MTDIVTVPIHHPELDAESWVPEETVTGWLAQGWVEGRLARLAEADELAAEEAAAAAKAAAMEWAAAHPLPGVPADDEIDAELDEPAPVADAGPPDADESVPTGTNDPTNPEEGES